MYKIVAKSGEGRISKTYRYETATTFGRGWENHSEWYKRVLPKFTLTPYELVNKKWVEYNPRIKKVEQLLERERRDSPEYIVDLVTEIENTRKTIYEELYESVEQKLRDYDEDRREQLITLLKKTVENGHLLIDDPHISALVMQYQKSQ